MGNVSTHLGNPLQVALKRQPCRGDRINAYSGVEPEGTAGWPSASWISKHWRTLPA